MTSENISRAFAYREIGTARPPRRVAVVTPDTQVQSINKDEMLLSASSLRDLYLAADVFKNKLAVKKNRLMTNTLPTQKVGDLVRDAADDMDVLEKMVDRLRHPIQAEMKSYFTTNKDSWLDFYKIDAVVERDLNAQVRKLKKDAFWAGKSDEYLNSVGLKMLKDTRDSKVELGLSDLNARLSSYIDTVSAVGSLAREALFRR